MRLPVVFLTVVFLGGSLLAFPPASGSAQTPAPSSTPLPVPAPSGNAPAAPYPPAPTSSASDTYFGTVVADPYRPLESIDAPATKAWIASENAATRSYLDAIPSRPAIAAAYRKLYNHPKMTAPYREGKRYFYGYNTGLQTQYVEYVRDSENGQGRVYFDPNTLSKDGSVQLTGESFSRDGSLEAYATSTGGEDWQTWHVKVVATGRDTADVIHWSKFSGATWVGDAGFYYAGYDAPTRRTRRFPRSACRRSGSTGSAPRRARTNSCSRRPRIPIASSGRSRRRTNGTSSFRPEESDPRNSRGRRAARRTPRFDS
jgi:hypothetical protein